MDVDASLYGLHTRRKAGTIISIDLGQAQDFSAITVNEREGEHFEKAHDGKRPDHTIWHHQISHAQRLPLGTSYPTVVEYVANMVKELTVTTERGAQLVPELVADATGVGRPVVDMMKRMSLRPVSVIITGGVQETRGGDFNFGVPKRNLVNGMVAALQEGRLKFSAGLPFIDELVREMLNFKAKVSSTGHESSGAWRESIHDDLVLSTALAVWLGERNRRATITPLFS